MGELAQARNMGTNNDHIVLLNSGSGTLLDAFAGVGHSDTCI